MTEALLAAAARGFGAQSAAPIARVILEVREGPLFTVSDVPLNGLMGLDTSDLTMALPVAAAPSAASRLSGLDSTSKPTSNAVG